MSCANHLLLEPLNPFHHKSWDAAVSAHPNASIFHTAGWARVLAETYGYQPYYLGHMDGGICRVLIPLREVASWLTGRRGVSLPFSDACPPLLSGEVSHKQLRDELFAYGRAASWRTLGIRNTTMFQDEVLRSSTYFGHALDVSVGRDRLFKNLKDSTRRNIKKAERENVITHVDSSMDAINRFYKLHGLTRKLHGLPPQPISFFKAIHEHLIRKGLGFVVLAKHRERDIAASVFLLLGKRMLFKFGASNRAFQHVRPNDKVMWEAICYASEHGFTDLNFGRTDVEDRGLRDYKLGWGAREYPIEYVSYNLLKEAYEERKTTVSLISHAVFRHLPVPVLKLAGSLMYKHLG